MSACSSSGAGSAPPRGVWLRFCVAARAALFCCALAWPAAAAGDEPQLFAKGVAALDAGANDEAIQTFEALADRGFVHPDLSYDRALAYLGRVRAGAERPGDLGRAAAALEEALMLRPSDRDAEVGLDLVRAEVARRRSRSASGSEIDARPTLERAIVGLLSEQGWSMLALVASALLTLGLVLRWRSPQPLSDEGAPDGKLGPTLDHHEGPLHVAATVLVPLGAALLTLFALLAWGGRHLRMTSDPGVVVAPEAHLVSDHGVLTSLPPIPEAARVELGEQRGSLVEVRWGTLQGFTQTDAVRRLRLAR
jgi:hypothetical protein